MTEKERGVGEELDLDERLVERLIDELRLVAGAAIIFKKVDRSKMDAAREALLDELRGLRKENGTLRTENGSLRTENGALAERVENLSERVEGFGERLRDVVERCAEAARKESCQFESWAAEAEKEGHTLSYEMFKERANGARFASHAVKAAFYKELEKGFDG